MRASISLLTLAAATLANAAANCTYPSQSDISAVFAHLTSNDYDGFFARVQPGVNWTVEGTHPLAGQYNSIASFVNATLVRLSVAYAGPANATVYNVVGGCEQEWSVTEFNERAALKRGGTFDNNYAWSTRWNTAGNITEVRAYLDSALVARTVVDYETPSYTYSDVRS